MTSWISSGTHQCKQINWSLLCNQDLYGIYPCSALIKWFILEYHLISEIQVNTVFSKGLCHCLFVGQVMSPHFTEPNALHIVLHICYTTKGNNTCHFAIFSGLKVVQNEQLLSPLTSFTNLSILQIFWMDWFQSQLTFLFQKKWKRVQCPKWGIVPLRRTGLGRISHTFFSSWGNYS